MEISTANALLRDDPNSARVIKPYINGVTLMSSPDLSPAKMVADFSGMSLEQARNFRGAFNHVLQTVKPYRDLVTVKAVRERWWVFARERPALRSAISDLSRLLVKSQSSDTWAFAFIDSIILPDQTIVAFPLDDYGYFAVMQSTIHFYWAATYGGSLKDDMRYTPSDCFENFPLPSSVSHTAEIGNVYYNNRHDLMVARQEGLTKTYNRFHDPSESAADIQKLRDLHVEMDKAVAAAYGWSDLVLGHGFHETKQGIRFTISESARREVLSRLLKLNHERYAEEVKQGLHDKKGKAKPASTGRGRKSNASPSTPSLKFGDDEDDPDPAEEIDEDPTPTRKGTSPKAARADRQVQPTPTPESSARPTPIDEIDTDDIMAAFRQAARGKAWLDRDELLKEASLLLGFQRLGPRIDEALRGHLRASIRRRIIETDGPTLVRAGAVSMADYEPDELIEIFRSVMRKGATYDREEIIPALARHIGFVRLTDGIREPIRKAITRAIQQGILGYEGDVIWREQ
jgi:hypothetical protein